VAGDRDRWKAFCKPYIPSSRRSLTKRGEACVLHGKWMKGSTLFTEFNLKILLNCYCFSGTKK